MQHEPAPLKEDRIDDYLARLERRLPRRMSPSVRAEQRSELKAHLEALITAHQELGADEDAAIARSLEAFGAPEQLGRQLGREWRRAAELRHTDAELIAVIIACLPAVSMFFVWPAAAVAAPADAMLAALAGYFWGRNRGSVGLPRVLLVVAVFAALLVPVQQDYGVPALAWMARLLLLFRWLIVAGSAAGLTSCLTTLAARRKRRRAA